MTVGGPPSAGVAGWPVSTRGRRSSTVTRWIPHIEGRYELFPVPPGDFPKFAAGIGSDGLLGANVTVPHKEAAFAACARRTPVAEALGAVNVLWREEGHLWGDNTDVEGFLANLDEFAAGWDARRGHALVIGAGGGGGRSYALHARGFERIVIVNRTQSRAEALAQAFGGWVGVLGWSSLHDGLGGVDCLVNASTLGMAGQPALDLDIAALPAEAVVADLVYVPLRTPLIEAAGRRGLRTAAGLGMLLHQAAPAFERWFGRRPRVTPELRALIEADVMAADKGRK